MGLKSGWVRQKWADRWLHATIVLFDPKRVGLLGLASDTADGWTKWLRRGRRFPGTGNEAVLSCLMLDCTHRGGGGTLNPTSRGGQVGQVHRDHTTEEKLDMGLAGDDGSLPKPIEAGRGGCGAGGGGRGQ